MNKRIILEEDAISTDESINAIGATIQARRRELGISLRELSKRSGLSIGFLSRVERGLSLLALTSLSNIAKALQMELSSFFPMEKEASKRDGQSDGTEEAGEGGQLPGKLPYVNRANSAVNIAVLSRFRTFNMLSPRRTGAALEPLLVTIPPGDPVDEPYGHDGEEFAYVLAGELVYIVNDVEYYLGPGDSIHLDSTVPHTSRNDTTEPVQVLWVLTPRLM